MGMGLEDWERATSPTAGRAVWAREEGAQCGVPRHASPPLQSAAKIIIIIKASSAFPMWKREIGEIAERGRVRVISHAAQANGMGNCSGVEQRSTNSILGPQAGFKRLQHAAARPLDPGASALRDSDRALVCVCPGTCAVIGCYRDSSPP
ncbi:hypothetical protein SKAU_G00323570 [Synaphobranchus kaupii]|uniref:Uncharacterized protein n=1 Tax=Synaphobranchus kaupii TaxID=118154 RepID=A0A9Q1EP91_SYNKA|nr:hypothetical protein SKAU_G00323570 [Synaphobranchus kaupii]